MYDETPLLQVVNVTHIPDQTPSEVVVEAAEKRADRIADNLSEVSIDAEYTVEGHISRNVGFGIVQTARNEEADLILMGYPEEHPDITERVEYDAPCDVLYVDGFSPDRASEFPVVNVGAGGGPHHPAMVSLVGRIAERGVDIRVIDVEPGNGGTPEDPQATLDALPDGISVQVQSITAETVAEGLVSTASENGGILIVGASRTRGLKRWLLGSTPDRVIERAQAAGVPVIVYASETSVRGRAEDFLFPLYRYYARLRSRDRPVSPQSTASSESR
jgi:nucleotide-binding universal stress UspA family protein